MPFSTRTPANRWALFYLDRFPRETENTTLPRISDLGGKTPGRRALQRPTTCWSAIFPRRPPIIPPLLSHDEVEALFHEFGHAMHSILTRRPTPGSPAPAFHQDFVEAPSQMLRKLGLGQKVLDSFAANYRHPEQKIPANVLDQLKAARLATMGTYYRRQLSFALCDLASMGRFIMAASYDPVKISNETWPKYFCRLRRIPLSSLTSGTWPIMTRVITVTPGRMRLPPTWPTNSKKRRLVFFDVAAGRRLRNEIYAWGSARDVFGVHRKNFSDAPGHRAFPKTNRRQTAFLTHDSEFARSSFQQSAIGAGHEPSKTVCRTSEVTSRYSFSKSPPRCFPVSAIGNSFSSFSCSRDAGGLPPASKPV